jgi:Xaa-Pro dipeptidase
VRLEDVVVVTAKGPVNLTTCPRTIKEIESVIAGGPWPPLSDDAPYLHRRWGQLAPGGNGMLDIKLDQS